MDNRTNNGGARKGAGRKKGGSNQTTIEKVIKKNCEIFIREILKNEVIKRNQIKQMSMFEEREEPQEIKYDYLYIIKNNGLYKIGYSSNWDKRYKNYKTHLGIVDLVYLIKTNDSFKLENDLHLLFKDKRVTGEWFDMTDKDLLKAINYCSNELKHY